MKSLSGSTNCRRICLLRHGAVVYAEPDGKAVDDAYGARLSAAGRARAALLAELLSAITFDRVVHSDLPRAYVNHQRS